MEAVLEFIQANITIAPWVIFGVLLLAGLNLPVSEDALIFVSALISAKNPDMRDSIFIGLFLGAYLSDLISFSLGWFLGPKLWKIKWFEKMVTKEMVVKIQSFFNKYGILTLILGRFIPFGVRNGMFLSAGMSKMNPIKFALGDLVATSITVTLYFWLYYTYGEAVIEIIKKFNVVIFAIFAIGLVIFILNKRKQKSLS